MGTQNAGTVSEESNAVRTSLIGGLIAGATDITAAFIHNVLVGRPAVRALHGVASGLLGSEAFQGGLAVAALGLLCHFCIAISATAVYFFASRKLKFMVSQPLVAGPVFGILVYAFMNSVTVPLSAAPFTISYNLTGILIHIFCVGLPIALVVSKLSK